MAELQQLQELFEQREKKILEEASQLAREVARRELALLEFELFYGVMIPEESKRKSAEFVQKLRQEKWKRALEKTHGNEREAMLIYDAA